MRRGGSVSGGNGGNGRSPSSQPIRLPPLLRRLLPPPTGGRRAVALVACPSLFLYLTLAEPYYTQQKQRQQVSKWGDGGLWALFVWA